VVRSDSMLYCLSAIQQTEAAFARRGLTGGDVIKLRKHHCVEAESINQSIYLQKQEAARETRAGRPAQGWLLMWNKKVIS